MEPLRPTGLPHRRQFLGGAAFAGATWLTTTGHLLHRAGPPERRRHGQPKSIILLWMQGGPSQLETFDPHPGTDIAGGTRAVATSVRGVRLAEGMPLVAEQMGSMAVIRSMVSEEGDHERGTYNMKTGYRPDPTVVHPSIGAILCHQLPSGDTDIPRHISILPSQWAGKGGYLGEAHDAFTTGDPLRPVPDTVSHVTPERDEKRLRHLDVVEAAFARGRKGRVEATQHRETITAARRMMSSEQLRAFNVASEPLAVRRKYGDTPFGRACLAARRLTEAGVRCVEVTLDGWDSHANNHDVCRGLVRALDPAFAALLRDLKRRDTLKDTVVLCLGEFGRTPVVNPLGGRDHWPHGFSAAVAGGGLRGGVVVGETDPNGGRQPADPTPVANLHATVLRAVGIDPARNLRSPIGRTFPRSEGTPLAALLG